MENSIMNTQGVRSASVETNNLTIGDTHVSGVATGTSVDPKNTDLVNRGYLEKEMAPIKEWMHKLDPDGTMFSDMTVVSRPLNDPYFNEEKQWHLNNWVINDLHLCCPGGDNNNSASLLRDLYDRSGIYFIKFVIDRCDSGRVELFLNDVWVKTFDSVGTEWVEVFLEHPDTDMLELRGEDITARESIEFSEIAYHYVTPRFYNYILNKVKQLASIDATSHPTREEYERTLRIYEKQFDLRYGLVETSLNSHANAKNPHGTTPADIGAAPDNHTHTQYLTSTSLPGVADKLYAGVNHQHSEYVTPQQLTEQIQQGIHGAFGQGVAIAPVILIKGPEGMLPDRYSNVGIDAPAAIFRDSKIIHNGEGSYDIDTGFVATNLPDIMHTASKFYTANPEDMLTIPDNLDPIVTPINIRLTMHCPRVIKGYKLYSTVHIPSWSVYNGNTAYIHRITNIEPEKVGDLYVYSIDFAHPEVFSMFSFRIEKITRGDASEAKCCIEFITVDSDKNVISFNDTKLSVNIPVAGTNNLVEIDGKDVEIVPDKCIPNLPLYIFAKYQGDKNPSFAYSYYPPEYENNRQGINIFQGKFADLPNGSPSMEQYTHPAYGTLRLDAGTSLPGYPLKNIYSEDFESWKSEPGARTITITQSIDSNNVVLCGYILSWRNEEIGTVPTTWTLTVEGTDIDGNVVTKVVDSVDQYYPFYSVEDDDIVHHAPCFADINVKRIMLTMATNDPSGQISLNQLKLFLCERYYSIAENKMYNGLSEEASICIGRAYYDSVKGWKTRPVCYGTSVVVPVNSLNKCNGAYEIDNPFFTTDVVATLQSYYVQESDVSSFAGQAYITSVTPEKITLYAIDDGVHAVTITRIW